MDEQVNIPALSSSNLLVDAFWIFKRSMVCSFLSLSSDGRRQRFVPSQFELKECQEKTRSLVIR